jgi:peptidoglycan/xylan/chitin deacetylase (PgdA/CDA1 family)
MVEIYNNPNKNGCCCLLFIDNPVEYTDKIIKILDETDVKASFFFGVKNMKKYRNYKKYM